MEYRHTKWLMYTVLIGLIPIILRLLLYFFLSSKYAVEIINVSDIIIFGLIIHISIINELEHHSEDKNWKTKHIGFSVFFIIIYSSLFALMLFSNEVIEVIDSKINFLVIIMSLVSLLIGFTVHYNSSLKVAHE